MLESIQDLNWDCVCGLGEVGDFIPDPLFFDVENILNSPEPLSAVPFLDDAACCKRRSFSNATMVGSFTVSIPERLFRIFEPLFLDSVLSSGPSCPSPACSPRELPVIPKFKVEVPDAVVGFVGT
jgi:hypothetical protein